MESGENRRPPRILLIVSILIISLAVNISLGMMLWSGLDGRAPYNAVASSDYVEEDTAVTMMLQGPAVIQKADTQSRSIPGVIVSEGIMLNISVEIRRGEGRVLVETEPLTGTDFQEAAVTAVKVASGLTGWDRTGSDVIFSVEAEEGIPEVDGPSAGALMTALLVAAITHTSPDEGVTVTGTIDERGHIGAIGGVVEKARAAKESGKRLLLVPEENAVLLVQEERMPGRSRYPGVVMQRTVDAETYIEETIGIDVEYVNDITGVISHILG